MKTHKYKVGDICVAYNDPTFTALETTNRYNGEECEVIALLVNHITLDEIVGICYKVKFGDDTVLLAKEHELRRKGDDDWVKQKIANLIDFPLPVELVQEPETV